MKQNSIIKRDYNNSHNCLNGSVRCVMTYARTIRGATSLTHRGRRLIIEVERLLAFLDKETWTFRQELDGSVTTMKHKNERKFFI